MEEIQPTAIELRLDEVNQYQSNINMFTGIASSLPSELPEHLSAYRARVDKHAAAAEVSDLDDLSLLSDVWLHDEMQARIRSEMVEMRKSQAILSFLQSQ